MGHHSVGAQQSLPSAAHACPSWPGRHHRGASEPAQQRPLQAWRNHRTALPSRKPAAPLLAVTGTAPRGKGLQRGTRLFGVFCSCLLLLLLLGFFVCLVIHMHTSNHLLFLSPHLFMKALSFQSDNNLEGREGVTFSIPRELSLAHTSLSNPQERAGERRAERKIISQGTGCHYWWNKTKAEQLCRTTGSLPASWKQHKINRSIIYSSFEY